MIGGDDGGDDTDNDDDDDAFTAEDDFSSIVFAEERALDILPVATGDGEDEVEGTACFRGRPLRLFSFLDTLVSFVDEDVSAISEDAEDENDEEVLIATDEEEAFVHRCGDGGGRGWQCISDADERRHVRFSDERNAMSRLTRPYITGICFEWY